MLPKNALELLFEYDFGRGPLFKNQVDLVNELIGNHNSAYYLTDENELEYSRAVSRLKAYISQLLSDSARRSVTPELHESLRILIKEKLFTTEFDADEILELIVTDFKNRNKKSFAGVVTNRRGSVAGAFLKDIVTANYISVFTTREITFEYELFEKRISFVNLLLENLVDTLINGKHLKHYRFNFPLEQTCQLFWMGLRKEIVKYLKSDKKILGDLLLGIKPFSILSDTNTNKAEDDRTIAFEDKVAFLLLDYLSKKGVINVFHLRTPTYIVPSVTVNPNESNKASTYLFLQSSHGNDNIHKLTGEEQLLWKFFVWDNLKKNKSGVLIKYSPEY